jgi:excisionase family DNA binding protein
VSIEQVEQQDTVEAPGEQLSADATRFKDGWMTTEQVCDWMQVKVDWLYGQVARKTIPHVKVGRLLRFRKTDLEAWMETHRQ